MKKPKGKRKDRTAFTFQISKAVLAKVRTLAERAGISDSAAMRQIVDRGLEGGRR